MVENKFNKHMNNIVSNFFGVENFQYSNQGGQRGFIYECDMTSFIC